VSTKKSPQRGGTIPPLLFVEAFDTSRLIPSLYSPNEDSVLVDVVHNPKYLQKVFDFDDATNDRLLIEGSEFDKIDETELVAGIPYASVINAAYTHSHKEGNRFSVFNRNAWYAALNVRTSQIEVIFHRTIELHEMRVYEHESTYDEYLADFRCQLHDLRGLSEGDPILSPTSYVESQKLAEKLFGTGSLGLIYSSVRDAQGTCTACFRPALVTNVRKGVTFRFHWVGQGNPVAVEIEGKH
jgi:hypothetical protein